MKAQEALKKIAASDHGDVQKCGCGCGQPLEGEPDEKPYIFNGKAVNRDCYFAIMSSIIDEDPIGPGRVR